MGILTNHYVLSFIKFAILATLGEVIAASIKNKKLTIPHSIGYRMFIWGLLGIWIAFMMGIFASAIGELVLKGREVTFMTKLEFAFITSLVMNTSFGPIFMILHKHTDTFLDLRYENKGEKISLKKICSSIDYYGYIKNIIIVTIPAFWLPAHTITFLLPGEFRVIFAAALSICLGVILSLK